MRFYIFCSNEKFIKIYWINIYLYHWRVRIKAAPLRIIIDDKVLYLRFHSIGET
ncbi:uncharacterized protein METZ01_LOCUS164638 [marine metagenome]|uniref:Uncharacterized protein n=1 Tax=marine metagenome TaxID=408172 RepID=A0A382BDP5_9ZZZZ